MTMIPGAMEPRRPSSAAGNPAALADRAYARAAAGRPVEAKIQRPELPGWLKVSIGAAVLIAAMWLVMSVF
jgi:hypothetical protein